VSVQKPTSNTPILQRRNKLTSNIDLLIPMKSPGHSEMMPPMDSDMMSPRARASLAAEL
jgi:hypothetical protein